MLYLIQFGHVGHSCRCTDYESATSVFHALQHSYQWVRVSQGMNIVLEYDNRPTTQEVKED